MNFDRAKFFTSYRHQFGSLKQTQVDGLEFLLSSIEQDAPLLAEPSAMEKAAYMLATTMHETGTPGVGPTFQPIDELGGDAYFNRRYGPQTKVGQRLGNKHQGDGAKYHGRGFVQLTGRDNYIRAQNDLLAAYPAVVAEFEQREGLRFDLVEDPAQVKDAAVAYAIMSHGMRKGRFTGRMLSEFFNASRADAVRARQIINGLDRATLIATYWDGLVRTLKESIV